MHPKPISARILLHAILLAAGVGARAGGPPTDWPRQQRFEASAPGLVKLSLPVETLDAARPNLEDLRLYDAEGNEVAYAIERPRPGGKAVRRPRSFLSTLEGKTTVIKLETGFSQPIDRVTLETPAFGFIKPVQVEGSTDGQQWETLSTGRPVFRQAGGASQLDLPVPPRVWPWLRLKVDDRRSGPVPFTGAQILAADPETAPLESVPAGIADRYENPGVTRLTVRLPAANLDVATLRLETDEPLFTREVTVAVPQVAEDAIREQTVARGVIYRIAVDDSPAATNLAVAVESRVRSREVVLLIRNQDSPPLGLSGVRVERRPVYLVFYARQAGAFRLLAGNSRCAAPAYDVAALGADLKKVPVAAITVSPLEDNPTYRAPEVLAGVQDGATVLDVSDWKFRKPLKLSAPGAQQVELDPEVLSQARSDFGDLRLVRGGRQVPYVLERTSISRKLAPAVSVAADRKDPQLTRWSLKFEHANLPLVNLRCAAATPLFQRDMNLFEDLRDDRGETCRRALASAVWVRTPESAAREFVLQLEGAPRSDVLVLETRNGDSPPIQLEKFQADYLATRVLFKAGAGEELFLYYGNPGVAAPRYDLSLVAGQLLGASKTTVSAGAAQQLKKAAWSETHTAGKGGWVFWGILGLVVVVLLAVISRMLPKNPAP